MEALKAMSQIRKHPERNATLLEQDGVPSIATLGKSHVSSTLTVTPRCQRCKAPSARKVCVDCLAWQKVWEGLCLSRQGLKEVGYE